MSIALAVAPFIVIFLMLFSGFYVNDATLPAVLRWSEWCRAAEGGALVARLCNSCICMPCSCGAVRGQAQVPGSFQPVAMLLHTLQSSTSVICSGALLGEPPPPPFR